VKPRSRNKKFEFESSWCNF